VVIFSLLQMAQRADDRDQELFKHWGKASEPGARSEKSSEIFGAQVELKLDEPQAKSMLMSVKAENRV